MRKNKSQFSFPQLGKNPNFDWDNFHKLNYYLNKWGSPYGEVVERAQPILTLIKELDTNLNSYREDKVFALTLEAYREIRKIAMDKYFEAIETKIVTE